MESDLAARSEAEKKSITDLDAKGEEISRLTKQVEQDRIEYESLKAQKETLSEELLEARSSFLLSPGNPYPNGLSVAQIGMSKAEVIKSYSSEGYEIDQSDPDFVSVDIKNGPISGAQYYLDKKSGKVTHIAFSIPLAAKFPEDFLQTRLVEAFGKPVSEPRPHFFRWHVGNKWNVLKANRFSFIVLKDKDVVAYWPEE